MLLSLQYILDYNTLGSHKYIKKAHLHAKNGSLQGLVLAKFERDNVGIEAITTANELNS